MIGGKQESYQKKGNRGVLDEISVSHLKHLTKADMSEKNDQIF
jgi:hypothetical protein